MEFIRYRDRKRIFKDCLSLLKIHFMNPKIALSLSVIPLKIPRLAL